MAAMTELTILAMPNNQLTGTVPKELYSLTALSTLYLHNNPGLTGTLDPIFCPNQAGQYPDRVEADYNLICDCCF